MKTPKQEADELISLFYGVVDKEIDSGQLVRKQCALILVERILKMELAWEFKDSAEVWGSEIDSSREYWEEVKEEILKEQDMEFTEKRKQRNPIFWKDKRDGFVFKLGQTQTKKWFAFVKHQNKDIRFNSLWESIEFDTKEDAETWCEKFIPERFNCLGKDVNVNK